MPYSTDDLYTNYPFLMKYFENGVMSPDKSIAHCILLYGNDLDAQYSLALEVARMLNCTGSHTRDCRCLNCNWIRENNHPAVLTISKVDNKSANDNSKTVISIEQARMIKNDLLITSGYHRVYIFCDKDKDKNICGLNVENFQEPTANALLKTFEEPPARTTFFFLTQDKSDMISTIISRSQCFFVPNKRADIRAFDAVQELMDGYLELKRSEVLDFNDKLLEISKTHDMLDVLTQMQNYMTELLKSNVYNTHLKMKLLHDIQAVENAKKQLRVDMFDYIVSENLAYELILH